MEKQKKISLKKSAPRSWTRIGKETSLNLTPLMAEEPTLRIYPSLPRPSPRNPLPDTDEGIRAPLHAGTTPV